MLLPRGRFRMVDRVGPDVLMCSFHGFSVSSQVGFSVGAGLVVGLNGGKDECKILRYAKSFS